MSKSIDDRVAAKRLAGIEVAAMVQNHMVVGLGTGVTSSFAIEQLGKRVRDEGLDIVGIPTSFEAAANARRAGIRIQTLYDVSVVNLAFDGADEVDTKKNLIKGAGGAFVREKVIDSAAEEFIVVVDGAKVVDVLGRSTTVPIEVLPFALPAVTKALKRIAALAEVRVSDKKIGPVVTENGNVIVDASFGPIDDPAALEAALNDIPGVVDNGLFVGLASLVLIGLAGELRVTRLD